MIPFQQRKMATVVCTAVVGQSTKFFSMDSQTAGDDSEAVGVESPWTVLYKLQSAASTANSIMGLHDPFLGRPLDAVKALRALVHTFPSIDNAAHLMGKRDVSKSKFPSPSETISKQEQVAELEELSSSFEFADAAYEDKDVLKLRLQEQGYYLLFHDKHTKPGQVSYYMGFNPTKKIVLIGIKGTDAVTDMLTNLICLPMEKKLGGVSSGGVLGLINNRKQEVAYLHEGMTMAALNINEQIFDTLKHLFLPQGYDIVITGHSLGAGTASILGLLLRDELQNLHDTNVSALNLIDTVRNRDWSDRVKVLAYATPPVMDYKTAESTRSFITSVVLKTDIIPRASINNLITIMNVLFEIDTMIQKPESSFEPWNFKLSSKEAYDILKRSIEKAPHEKTSSMMFVPGKVLRVFDEAEGGKSYDEDEESMLKEEAERELMKENEDTKKGTLDEEKLVNGKLSSIITDGSDYALRMIHPSSSMLSDHLGVAYRQALQQLLQQHQEGIDFKAEELHIDPHGDFYTK